MPASGVLWLALIPTFSPWEKEKPSPKFGFADERPADPVAQKKEGRVIHPAFSNA
jgi:hypothetical protein